MHVRTSSVSVCFIRLPRPPTSTLFPYTTLFRSHATPQLGADRIRLADPEPGILLRLFQAQRDALVLGVHVQDQHVHFVTDRKSTRLNSSHLGISYAVFCLKKKKHHTRRRDLTHQ